MQNATRESVRPGTDRYNSERDVTGLTNMFMRQYMAGFFKRWGDGGDFEGATLPQEVIREVIHMHKDFVEQWDDTHKRSLAPVLQAGRRRLWECSCLTPCYSLSRLFRKSGVY